MTDVLKRVAVLPIDGDEQVAIDEITAALADDIARPLARALAAIDPWARYHFTPSQFAGYFGDPAPIAPRYLLRRGDDIAGLVALKLGWMFGTYLQLIAVLPAHQGRGIGGAVLDWLDQTARGRGERNQFVVTSTFNIRGLALYQAHDFTPIATMPGLINDRESEILLRKRLT